MTTSNSQLPDYIASAKPNPPDKRVPWFSSSAPTYAGIFLWFVFWDSMAGNGLSTGGLGALLAGIVIGALICHFLFFLVPGTLGMRTGLPLYVVGTSTFGAAGGLLMPGFLMGALQFGWLGVNACGSADALSKGFNAPGLYVPLCVVWTVLAAFVGLKGIQYVAKVATYLPLIPLAVLVMGLVLFGGSAANFKPAPSADGGGATKAMLGMIAGIVGFFATAGAAGVDICSSNRDKRDVNMCGLVGIVIAIIFTAGISVIAVAGAQASGVVDPTVVKMTSALQKKLAPGLFATIMIGLTLASFPGACFSSFIAANSFKTTMPKVNPFLSVGIGAIVSILIAIIPFGAPVEAKLAAKLPAVFGIIGASFGPIVGAMVVDYLLSGKQWVGPRAGFNPAGWIAWALGFIVGILPNLHAWKPETFPDVPVAPVLAFVVGAVIYFLCAKMGMQSQVIPLAALSPEPLSKAAAAAK
ncbi:MAG TPA: cytosine permease [Verrucomicrobiae bacterium]|nr:cytosine permease [Verrucomicrobiae bacterium]